MIRDSIKLQKFFRGAICFGLLTILAVSISAREPYRRRATPTPAPTGILISAVNADSITVADQNSAKTVMVGPLTEITVNGQRSKISDLKSGMRVSLGLSDPTHASKVTATTTQ